MDTIFALASAPGKAGVSVLRVSGPDAYQGAEILCQTPIKGRGMWLRALTDDDGQILDHALVLGFQSPASFTGEDVVEYHLHGSIATVRSVLSNLSHLSGHRMAEPGEFTRRALQNGKMDLPQIEGLADLIDAETEAQRKQRYLIPFVAPELPDEALEPERLWNVLTVFFGACLVYAIGGLVWSALNDHL